LTRVTSSGEFIPQIDGLRFLAILLVLGHHVFAGYLVYTHRLGTQQLPRDWAVITPRSHLITWVLHLQFGVQLFFAISGFVLVLPFARSYLRGTARPRLGMYYLRRLIRLEPPYILHMILMFLVIVIPVRQLHPWWFFTSYVRAFGPHLLATLVYLHAVVYGEPSWINGVAWSLEIEIQFYILLPVLAALFAIRRTVARRAIWIALILATAVIAQFVVQPSGNSRLILSLANQLHFFLVGILLADIYLEPGKMPQQAAGFADGLTVLSGALLVLVLHRAQGLAWTEPFLILGLYLGVFYGKWSSRLFSLPALTLPGGISYTTYLYHFFIITLLFPLTVRMFPPVHALWWDAGVQFVLMLAPVFGVSAALFMLTERPFMVLSRRVARRFRQPETVAAGAVATLEEGA
jgi:peptidoglycan/LPS O-acetylase OafA/YrhL